MKKEKEKEQLRVMPLGMAMQFRAIEDVKKALQPNDPLRIVLESMLRLRICGISALISIKDTQSTLEWDKKILEFLKRIYMAANLEDPIPIIGESGTGKESMARVIHEVGRGVENKIFVKMDCASIPENLIESYLFGHVKGAFTGALRDKTGYIKQAEGGTFFIDELAKMSLQSQSKMLNYIEYRRFSPVGSEKDLEVKDVRFVIALQPGDMEDEKKILPDLRNRLSPYNAINLPSLKERLKADPHIIHDVLNKLSERKDLRDLLTGDISDLQTQARDSSEKFDKSIRVGEIPFVDQPGKVLKNQIIITPESVEEWKKYIKIQYQISLREEPVFLSEEAFTKLVKYDGYDGKNFRELEGILLRAVKNAHIRERKEILSEDLPVEIMELQVKGAKKPSERIIYHVKNILLKDLIDHANEIRTSIIKNKIEEIYQSGKEIKTVLSKEGIKTDSEYTNIRNKIERILGNGSLKQIRDQFKTRRH